MLFRKVPLEKSPEVLRDRATELVKKFGYTEQPGDSAYGMGSIDAISITFTTPILAARWQRLQQPDNPPRSISGTGKVHGHSMFRMVAT